MSQTIAVRRMDTSTIVAILGAAFGFFASIVAGFFAWRSKKDELLFKERQDRIAIQATSAKEQSVATAASAETGFKALQATVDILQKSVSEANVRATRAETKADQAVAHAHTCDKKLAFLEAVATIKGWPQYAPVLPYPAGEAEERQRQEDVE